LIVFDELGYVPFEPEAANSMFSLVSSRHGRASLTVASNKPFWSWGKLFGATVTAYATRTSDTHPRTTELRLPACTLGFFSPGGRGFTFSTDERG
jgi:hypothetical protein